MSDGLPENEVVRKENEGGGEGTGAGGWGGGASSQSLFPRLFTAKKCKVASGKQKKTLELLHNYGAYQEPIPARTI